MNDVIRNLLERRTIRHYKEDQIAEEELQLILQAGLYASTAGDRKSTRLNSSHSTSSRMPSSA